MASKRNVIVGAASLYLGPAWDGNGTDPAPAFPAAADADATTPVAFTSYKTTLDGSATWDNPGYTQEGLEVSNEPDFGDVEVDQLLDSARIFKQSMRFSVNTTLAEATLENLLFAWGQKDATLANVTGDTGTGTTGTDIDREMTIEGGALGEAPLERGLIAVGNGPEVSGQYAERVYRLYRVLSVESSAHALRRNEATVFPVSFRCLPGDAGTAASRYGIIRDRYRA